MTEMAAKVIAKTEIVNFILNTSAASAATRNEIFEVEIFLFE